MAVINQAGGTIVGTEDPDTLTNTGVATPSTINGLGGNDTLQGNTGTDSLNGGAGADVMIGGTGIDTYVVDNLGDQIVENAGAGSDVGDVVQASINYVLSSGAGIEILTANLAATPGLTPGTGTNAINLTGNEQSQTAIIGNAGANVLDGGLDQVATNGNVTQIDDTLIGGIGNDTYIVRNSIDVVTEAANEGIDTVFVAPSQFAAAPNVTAGFVQSFVLTAGNSVEVLAALTAAGTEAMNLTGNELGQTIQGNNGVNALVGGTGAGLDVLAGLAGNDTYTPANTGSTIVEADGQGNDTLILNQGATLLNSANGNNATAYTLAAGVSIENIQINGGALNFTGNEFNQFIVGSAGANAINGGTGEDTMIGLAGDDTYIVNSAGDFVLEDDANGTFPGGGSTGDRINTSISYQLALNQNIEVLAAGTTDNSVTSDQDGSVSLNGISAATGDRFLVGNLQSQAIIGSSGANILDGNRINNTGAAVGAVAAGGLGGADTLIGLGGDDIYRVYAQTDVVLEDANGGFDRILTSDSFSLTDASQFSNIGTAAVVGPPAVAAVPIPGVGVLNGGVNFYTPGQAEIELLSTAVNSGTAAINLSGNGYGQIIVGNFGANSLSGGFGSFAAGGNIAANATSGGTVFGGVEALIGLAGNDSYLVTSTNTFVFEDAGGGNDVVNVDARFATTFTLNGGSSVETLQTANAAGIEAIALVGNEQQQTITGNAGNNTLSGGGFGGGDTLDGAAGDDTYRVFNGNDTITDSAGQDSVFASGVSYQLSATSVAGGVAIEYLSAAVQGAGDNIFLVGNQVSQVIVGNFGTNTLDGNRTAGGATEVTSATNSDTLVGLFGSDIYRVYGNNNDGNGGILAGGFSGDVVIEQAGAGGYDQVFASGNYQLRDGAEVEALSSASQTATGVAAEYILRGNGFGQLVVGNDAANTIDGRAGNDTLIGRGGNDVFAFTTLLDAVTNVDQIIDFAAGDRIGLATGAAGTPFANAQFTGGNGTTLTQADFQTVTTGSGTNSGAHIIYNTATGQLFYDADGTGFGGAVLFAQLAVGTQLGFNDIISQPAVVGLVAI